MRKEIRHDTGPSLDSGPLTETGSLEAFASD